MILASRRTFTLTHRKFPLGTGVAFITRMWKQVILMFRRGSLATSGTKTVNHGSSIQSGVETVKLESSIQSGLETSYRGTSSSTGSNWVFH